MTPPSVSKKAIQANRVPVRDWDVEGEKEKAELQNSEQKLVEKTVTH